MYEVELKVRADLETVRGRLAELGADRVDAVRQRDTYYDAPHREFAETDEALRIREETHDGEGTTRLTYKGPRIDETTKTREEFETAAEDSDALEGILDGLGFSPAATVEKEREHYAIEGFTVTLDSVTDVGEFVEVEVDVESEGEVDAAREEAIALLKRLELDPEASVRTSYLGLLLAGES
jgi:adenylate cyclase class 2